MSYTLTDYDVELLRRCKNTLPIIGQKTLAEKFHELVARIDECNLPIPNDKRRKDIGFVVRLVGKGISLQDAWDDASESFDAQREDPEDLEPEFLGYDDMFTDEKETEDDETN